MSAPDESQIFELDSMHLQPDHANRYPDSPSVSDLEFVTPQQPPLEIPSQPEVIADHDHESEVISIRSSGTSSEGSRSLKYVFLLGWMCASISNLRYECLTYALIGAS